MHSKYGDTAHPNDTVAHRDRKRQIRREWAEALYRQMAKRAQSAQPQATDSAPAHTSAHNLSQAAPVDPTY